MGPSNKLMQDSDWKKRCEAALLVNAVLTVQWSGSKAERKRLTHTMFKIRQLLEKADSFIGQEEYRAALDNIAEAIELTKLGTQGIGKKAAKLEGLAFR